MRRPFRWRTPLSAGQGVREVFGSNARTARRMMPLLLSKGNAEPRPRVAGKIPFVEARERKRLRQRA